MKRSSMWRPILRRMPANFFYKVGVMSLFNPNKLKQQGLNSYEVSPARRILSVLDAAVEHVVVGAQRHQYGSKPVNTVPNTVFTRVVGEDALQSYAAMPESSAPQEQPDVLSMMMGPKLAYYENKGVGNANTEVPQDTAAAVAAARQDVHEAYGAA